MLQRFCWPQPVRLARALMLVGAVTVVGVFAGAPETNTATDQAPAFREFTANVQAYIKLRKTAPRLRTTKKRQEIVDRRHGLADSIRAVRPDAKPGDIFSPAAAAEFRRVIRNTFQGPNAPNVRKTIRQGDPLAGWKLSVNGDYPEDLPHTTVPPTLLRRLPPLPQDVAYRIIGRDLVLQDTEARLVIDFIPGALP